MTGFAEDKTGNGRVLKVFHRVIEKVEVGQKVINRALSFNKIAVCSGGVRLAVSPETRNDVRFLLLVIIDIAYKRFHYVFQGNESA